MTGQLAVGLWAGSGWWCRWGQESRDRRAESDMSSASSSPGPYSPPGHLHTTHIKNMRCYVLKSLIVYPVSYLTTYSVREVKPFCVYASYTIHPFVLSPLGSKTWLQYPLLLLSHCQVSLPLASISKHLVNALCGNAIWSPAGKCHKPLPSISASL